MSTSPTFITNSVYTEAHAGFELRSTPAWSDSQLCHRHVSANGQYACGEQRLTTRRRKRQSSSLKTPEGDEHGEDGVGAGRSPGLCHTRSSARHSTTLVGVRHSPRLLDLQTGPSTLETIPITRTTTLAAWRSVVFGLVTLSAGMGIVSDCVYPKQQSSSRGWMVHSSVLGTGACSRPGTGQVCRYRVAQYRLPCRSLPCPSSARKAQSWSCFQVGQPRANQSWGPGAEKRPLLQPPWPANWTLVWVLFAARGVFCSGTRAWGPHVEQQRGREPLVAAAADESLMLIPHLLDAETQAPRQNADRRSGREIVQGQR